MATEKNLKFGMPWDGAGEGQSSHPFRIMVLAELRSRDPSSGESPPGSRPQRVDRDNFNEILAGYDLNPRLAVPDPAAGSGREKLVTFRIPDRKGFTPDALARNLPAAAELMAVRDLVVELRDGRLDAAAFAAAVSKTTVDPDLKDRVREALAGRSTPAASPSAPAPEKSADPLGDLMDLVDLDGSAEAAEMEVTPLTPSASTGRSSFDEVISLIARSVGQGRPVDAAATGAVLGELDAGIGAHLDEVLMHPEFRRLEAVWRGLELLIHRTDFRAGVTIEVLSVPPGRVGEAMDDLARDELSGAASVPVGLVVLDRPFGCGTPEVELLTSVAEVAEGIQAPVLVPLAPAFFGVEALDELAGLALLEYLDGPALIKWGALRKKECSRWLAAAVNGPLLRMPYRPGGARVKSLEYREPDGPLLTGSPALALAALVSQAIGRHGFAGAIAAPRGDGALEDLAVWPAAGGSSVEVVLDDGRRHDLMRAGIICFAGREGMDQAVLSAAPTVHGAEKFSDPDETEAARVRANLPYQLFVSRVAAVLNDARGRVPPNASGDEVAMFFKAALQGLLGDRATVAMHGREISVTPSRTVAGGSAPLRFGV